MLPGLKSARVSEAFFTFAPTTALFRSCAVPTLFLGSTVAAYPVPPRATTRARQATIIDGVKRVRSERIIEAPPGSWTRPAVRA
jgi:hypothetical protein